MALRSDLHGQELVAVKDGASAETLRREAALLADLDHPGIIRFVALTEDERGLRLLTRYAGRETLATWQPQRLEELRRAIEDLADTVHYLHERGVVHRSIRPGHVVIDALRRPLLCGFSAARRVVIAHGTPASRTGIPCSAGESGSDRRPEALSGDGGSGHDLDVDPAGEQLSDVVAIGETVLATLQRLEGHRARSGRRRDDQRLRERLQAVAQAAASGRVPTARALAGQIQTLGTDGGTQRALAEGVGDKAAVQESAADAPAPDGPRSRRADPGAGTSDASSGEVGAAGGEGGLHPQPRPEDVLWRLRAPAARRSRQRRSLRSVRPNAPDRHATQVPWRPRHARRPPRRATLLAVAAVCSGCALGTLMVVRLTGEGTPAVAPTGWDLTGGPATATQPPAPPDSAPTSLRASAVPKAPEHSGFAPAETPLRLHGTSGCDPVTDGFRDVTGDGCAEEVHVATGFVSVDGARYPVGEAGDQVAVGDWDCDGVATVALVQPNGRVYIFDTWPQETPLVGRLVADLTPPVQLADVSRGACNELLVRYAGGTWYLPLPAPSQ